MSVLKWIWSLLKRLFSFVDYLVRFVVDILSSVLAWIIGGIAWLVHTVLQYVGEAFYNMFASLEDVAVGNLQSNSLADWLGRDVLALDVAWECIAVAISVWFAARIARLSMSFVRIMLDLL